MIWEKTARDAREISPWETKSHSSLAHVDTKTKLDSFIVTICPAGCDDYEFTVPVGTFPAGASPYGALDMGER